jgi:RNA polymerase sigma factor (sigma-70 family)
MAKAQLSGVLRHLDQLRETYTVAEASDAELLARFADQHEEAAFAGLLRRHGPMVWAVSRRVLPAVQDAEDVFQAAFLLLARKAASIRKRESVGSWLHGVALHLALKAKTRGARRQAHEKRAADMRDTRPRSEAVRRDIQDALDRALQGLPERYRSALVLCYLQGKTHEEAARQLGCPLTTLRTRVARGRKLLRDQLTKNGLTLSAAGLAALLMASTAPAAVPAALVKAVLKAALPFAAGQAAATLCTAQVAGLVEGGLQTMFFSKAKMAVVLLVLGLVVGAGALANGGRAADQGKQPRAAAPREKPSAQVRGVELPPSVKEEAAEVMVSGRVLGPDDKPFAGAKLFVVARGAKKEDLAVKATTGDDGRFRVSVAAGDLDRDAKIVATAKAHGPDWVDLRSGKPVGEVTLRLSPDDVPIGGRLLDLEGRAVVGATVAVSWVEKVDLKPWLADKAKGDLPATGSIGTAALAGPTSVKTDTTGRFRLTGFGRDRVAHLTIRGDGIEHVDVEFIARPGPADGLTLQARKVYPADADLTVRPGKPIIGTVRDKKTGKPVSGIKVVSPNGNWSWPGATTDKNGLYRIDGIAKKKEYWVAAGGQPYFNSTKLHIADTPGLEPLLVEFDLERGILVKGRLTDKATGKPIRGQVGYAPLADNPNLKDFTDLGKIQVIASENGRAGDDGSFTVTCVPGPGLLTATADDSDAYVPARFETFGKKLGGRILQDNAVVSINPSEKDEKSTTCNIALEPARSVGGQLVGPDGQPLIGAYAVGLHALWQFGGPQKLTTASIQVHGLTPKEPRGVVFFHPEKRLAKVLKIAAEDKEPLTIRLDPTGTLAGRVLDAEGRPGTNLKVRATYNIDDLEQARLDGKDYKDLPWDLLYNYPAWDKIINCETTTDKDGKFRLDALIPGLQYYLVVSDGSAQEMIRREKLSVASGKVKELGDLKPARSPKQK